MYFYDFVSNGLVLLLQWLVTERSHKEDFADSSATNICHRYTTLQLSVAILKCLHWTNVCSECPKWLERTYDAGGSGQPGESIAFTEMELPLSITWPLPGCVKSLVSMSAELSEEWLAFASDVCDPSRLRSQEHAASKRAVYSCRLQLSCSQRCLIDIHL